MSLTDLKNRGGKKPKPKPKLSVDEFIDDAKAYAKGKSLISKPRQSTSSPHRNFKKATFTLAPDNIDELAELAQATGLAKSKLIRMMIEKAMKEGNFTKPHDPSKD